MNGGELHLFWSLGGVAVVGRAGQGVPAPEHVDIVLACNTVTWLHVTGRVTD